MDTIAKINNITTRSTIIRASWDELAAIWQVIARGIMGYVPMIGTQKPIDLHLEDIAFFHSMQTALGKTHTAEKN